MSPKIKIARDLKNSHLTIKDQDFPLVILRPDDLVQLGALVASGSEDILIWTGKNIGKKITNTLQNVMKKKKSRDKLIEFVLDALSNLGFGEFDLKYSKGKEAIIMVNNPISTTIKDKQDANVLCNLYNGIFMGMLNGTGLQVEGEEIECVLKGAKQCVYKYIFEEE